jgi:hypothetical protein
MTSYLKTTLILSVFVASSAFAQITIETDDLPIDHGTTIERAQIEEEYTTVDLGSAGANQTWDFTGMVTPDTWTEDWLDPATTSGFATFPNATEACNYSPTEEIFWYYETTQTNHLLIGIFAADPWPMSIPTTYLVTPDNFPLNYQDTWMSVSETQSFISGADVVDTTWGTVDGWGTLVDVTGSHSCLRVQSHIKSWTFVGGVPVNEMEHWAYSWIVAGGAAGVMIFSQDNETNPNFTMGDFVRTTGITGVKDNSGWTVVPTAVTLQPAFPNPFNPETSLTFSLPVADDVILSIYDSRGKLIVNLQNGWMMPGSYQTQFKADNLSSGIYFARFAAGDFQQTRKLVLMK